ncbi:hypothetical protein AVEN_28434-1 [Araneus ventricosus]|uniref:Uncharacterized protein n=1 Tax=Araneus ventricosus TaxID=182803 RepID=A0A4Y2SRQ5_ARAVE|nr:hypothetical protein AVEN_28434-1 [Araneus ventricosus]
MKLEIPRVGEEECGWEELCDFEPCLKRNFGTSLNVLPNLLTKMSGIQASCQVKWVILSVSGMLSLIERPRRRRRRVPSSKHDSIEDPPFMWVWCTLNDK